MFDEPEKMYDLLKQAILKHDPVIRKQNDKLRKKYLVKLKKAVIT